jgi:phosphoribosylformylglycinamidine synthase
VEPKAFVAMYRSLSRAIAAEIVASVHGIYRGGLGVHLAMVAMGGELGLDADLTAVPVEEIEREDTILYSESAGRFIVSIDPLHREAFETFFQGMPYACIGVVSADQQFVLRGLDGRKIVQTTVPALKSAWQKPFGDLI